MGSNLFKAGVAEALGVFFLTFVGGSAICMNEYLRMSGSADAYGLLGVALAHGLALMIGVYAFAGRSGAHINPAVTIALFVIGKAKGGQVVTYVFMQLLGGILGGLGVWGMFSKFKDTHPYLGHLSYDSETLSMVKAIGIEGMLTFVLMMVILMVAVDAGRTARQMFGLCIGFAVTIGILIGGPFTGAAMNPARYFGTAAVSGQVSQLVVYFVGPILGAIAAALVYKLFLEDKTSEAAPEVA